MLTEMAASSRHVLPLTPQAGWTDTRRFLDGLLHPPSNYTDTTNVAKIRVALDGQVYLAPITFGNSTYNVVLDTGSADTWLVTSNFTCMTVFSRIEQPQAACQFGPAYVPTLNYKKLPNMHFNISYADGEYLNGVMATETVNFANVEVKNQTIAAVNYAAWNGDSLSSGLMGLAFPNITRAFPGEDYRMDSRGLNVAYDPIFTSMWKKNLTAPVFSMALPRLDFTTRKPINTGALAIGGLPPPPIRYEKNFASAPIEYLALSPIIKDDGSLAGVAKKPEFTLYTIVIDGVVYAPAGARSGSNDTKPTSSAHRTLDGRPPSQNWNATTSASAKGTQPQIHKARRTAPIQATIDSGTTLVYLPYEVTKSINSEWDPPSWRDPSSSLWMVACNATGPAIGMQVDGKILWMDREDQVLLPKGGEENQCFSAVQVAQDGITILGDAWMRSVVSVFDVGAGMMRFSPRLD